MTEDLTEKLVEPHYQPVLTGWDEAGQWFVDIGQFEGPFDLLLQLVAKHEVDITSVALSEIVDEFLSVISRVDINLMSEFLVVAATLVEIKALRLLPNGDEGEVDEVAMRARDLLYARLLEYRMVRDSSVYIANLLEEGKKFFPRNVPLEAEFAQLQPKGKIGADLQAMGELAFKVCSPKETDIDTSHIRPKFMSIHEAATVLVQYLKDKDWAETSFKETVSKYTRLGDVVAHFLAVLELYKMDWFDIKPSDQDFMLHIKVEKRHLEPTITGAYTTIENS